jgi:hypothetical protein
MLLPPGSFRRVAPGLGPDRTVMDGRRYRPEVLTFTLNASLVRTPLGRRTWKAAHGVGLKLAPAQVSLVFFGIAFVVVLAWWLWRGRRRIGEGGDDRDDRARTAGEVIYWQIVLVLILLCAPVSWAMGVVWLLPAVAIVLREAPQRRDAAGAGALAVCGLALLLAALPDSAAGRLLAPFGNSAADQRYVVAELVLLAGLLLLGSLRYHRAAPKRAREIDPKDVQPVRRKRASRGNA